MSRAQFTASTALEKLDKVPSPASPTKRPPKFWQFFFQEGSMHLENLKTLPLVSAHDQRVVRDIAEHDGDQRSCLACCRRILRVRHGPEQREGVSAKILRQP
jgi:hypothetical protein